VAVPFYIPTSSVSFTYFKKQIIKKKKKKKKKVKRLPELVHHAVLSNAICSASREPLCSEAMLKATLSRSLHPW
jgi:hypothetical protein